MRLIDADALWEHHCESCTAEVREGCKTDPVCATLMWVDEAPTIEAEPVKHGKWEVGCAGKIRICSNCKESFDDTCNFIERDWQYCPNCGARMDGE